MLPKAIGIIGENGSGKTTTCIYIHNKHPTYRRFSFGDLWYDEAVKRGEIRPGERLENSRRSEIAREVMVEKGDLYPIERMMESIDIKRPILVDGIRQQEAIDYLRKAYGWENVDLIGIIADYETRLARLKARNDYTDEQFIHREEVDRRFGIQKLIDQCGYCLENSQGVEELFIPSIDLLFEVLKQKRR